MHYLECVIHILICYVLNKHNIYKLVPKFTEVTLIIPKFAEVIPKNTVLIPKFTELRPFLPIKTIPKLAVLIPKFTVLIPKFVGLVPKFTEVITCTPHGYCISVSLKKERNIVVINK